jgi:hypothetical protein
MWKKNELPTLRHCLLSKSAGNDRGQFKLFLLKIHQLLDLLAIERIPYLPRKGVIPILIPIKEGNYMV